MTDSIIILVLAAIVVGAGFYVYKAKKNGKKCIGCPAAVKCSGNCASCSSGCGKDAE